MCVIEIDGSIKRENAMSIKSVSCPRCKAPMNVAASMASTKCQSCGHVFPISGVAAAGSAQAGNQHAKARGAEASGDKTDSNLGQWLVVGGVTALAALGLVAITFFRVGAAGDPDPEKQGPPMRENAAVVEDLQKQSEDGEIEFRVVKLAESTRKSIYRDHKKMIASSFGKAMKIPKSGAAGQALNKGLGGIVDSEVTKISLIHGISEDDYAQIIAEGDAKGW